MADWIQNVDKEMEKKGTVGAFTKQATDEGMSVQDFDKKVKRTKTRPITSGKSTICFKYATNSK